MLCSGVLIILIALKGFELEPEDVVGITEEERGIGDDGDCRRLPEITGDCRRLLDITGDCRRLPEITGEVCGDEEDGVYIGEDMSVGEGEGGFCSERREKCSGLKLKPMG